MPVMVNNKWAKERTRTRTQTNDWLCSVALCVRVRVYVRRLMVVLIELPNGDFVKYPYLANGFVYKSG